MAHENHSLIIHSPLVGPAVVLPNSSGSLATFTAMRRASSGIAVPLRRHEAADDPALPNSPHLFARFGACRFKGTSRTGLSQRAWQALRGQICGQHVGLKKLLRGRGFVARTRVAKPCRAGELVDDNLCIPARARDGYGFVEAASDEHPSQERSKEKRPPVVSHGRLARLSKSRPAQHTTTLTSWANCVGYAFPEGAPPRIAAWGHAPRSWDCFR